MATSTRSLMMSGTPQDLRKSPIAAASAMNSAVEQLFSRSCTQLTPPATAARTIASVGRPPESPRSVTRYKE